MASPAGESGVGRRIAAAGGERPRRLIQINVSNGVRGEFCRLITLIQWSAEMPVENIIVLIIAGGGAVAFAAVTAWLSSEKVKRAGRG